MGGAVMKHPTDDGLEAMAVDLVFFHPGETSELAAAMLRACKGRVRVPTLQRLAQIIQGESGHAEQWALARADDVLAALEPAPDHAEKQAYIEGTQAGWDAAIEAAAKVANYEAQDAEYDPSYQTAAEVIEDRIRALKKGQSND